MEAGNTSSISWMIEEGFLISELNHPLRGWLLTIQSYSVKTKEGGGYVIKIHWYVSFSEV